MIIEEVVMYRANDGEVFYEREKAEEYICDKICGQIDKILKEASISNITGADIFKVVTALAGDIDKCKRLTRVFNSYID